MPSRRTPISRRFAGALGRKDFGANVELAEEIAESEDAAALREVLASVESGKRREAQDAIHVAFAVGERAPGLLVPHMDELVDTLHERDNRLVWGAVYALSTLVGTVPERCFEALPHVLDAAARSTVIAKYRALMILVGLAEDARYYAEVAPLLVAHVRAAAVNQLPTFADRAEGCLRGAERAGLAAVLHERLGELAPYPAKVRTVERVLARLGAARD